MSCPRCDFPNPGAVECPRCGVVLAKLDRGARPTPVVPVETSPASPGLRFSWLDMALLVGLAVSAGVIWSRWADPSAGRLDVVAVPARVQSEASPTAVPSTRDREAAPDPPATLAPDLKPEPPRGLPPTPAGTLPALQPDDAAGYRTLSQLVRAGREIESSHIERAETLHDRYPELPEVSRILEEVLELAARQEAARARPAEAARYRERATDLEPGTLAVWQRLIAGYQANAAWQEAERAARRGLSALPDESFLHLALAQALSRQGRDDEAADVLRRRLANRDDEAARGELARLEREMGSVAGLAARSSSHFSIRFEGEADDVLGRALLQVLESKHDMLARALDCEPGHEIPVILYPRQTFRSFSSAPDWAAGYYSRSDGRIRIGTRDLSPGFVPLDLERTLTHELAHAFIHARTRGAVPSDINEGLAQYLSGRRLGYRLDPTRVASGGGRMKVDDFYDAALSFVEYLLDRYRQSTMNDLLAYAGETGSVEQAFRRAYHQSYDETRQEWVKTLH